MLIAENTAKVAGIKVSLLDPVWERELRRRLPAGVKMYTGDDFNYAELIEGDASGHSHALLGICDLIAPVAAAALSELAAGRNGAYRELLAPTVALSREIFRAPTRHYKAGVVFLAWLNGHQKHFSMASGLQSARGPAHFVRVFELSKTYWIPCASQTGGGPALFQSGVRNSEGLVVDAWLNLKTHVDPVPGVNRHHMEGEVRQLLL